MSHQLGGGVFVVLLAAAIALSISAERVRIPAAVVLVAIGTAIGSVSHARPPFAFGSTVLFAFLPPLIFDAAWNLDLRALREQARRVALLAFPGTIFTAFAIAGALVAVHAVPFGTGLLFGAMVAATDPVAVVSVFRRIAVPADVRTIVEAESLLNDGVAVVLYGVGLALAAGGTVSWTAAALAGVAAIVGGVAVGAACAVPLWLALRSTTASEFEVTMTVALAYGAYLLADSWHLSGIFATTAAAIVFRALVSRSAHLTNRDDVDVFWNAFAYIADATVFLSTGLLIDIPRALHEPLLVVTAIAVAAAARAFLSVVAMSDRRARIGVFMAGMRGALPLALALSLPEDLQYRSVLIDGVFATVLVTLVLQGVSLEPVFLRLYRERSA